LPDKPRRALKLGELEISITHRIPVTDDAVKLFEDMGVSGLILLRTGQNEDPMLQYIDQIAKDFL
jgi:hypothetical protein